MTHVTVTRVNALNQINENCTGKFGESAVQGSTATLSQLLKVGGKAVPIRGIE